MNIFSHLIYPLFSLVKKTIKNKVLWRNLFSQYLRHYRSHLNKIVRTTRNELVAEQRLGLPSLLRHTCDVIQSWFPGHDTTLDVKETNAFHIHKSMFHDDLFIKYNCSRDIYIKVKLDGKCLGHSTLSS